MVISSSISMARTISLPDSINRLFNVTGLKPMWVTFNVWRPTGTFKKRNWPLLSVVVLNFSLSVNSIVAFEIGIAIERSEILPRIVCKGCCADEIIANNIMGISSHRF